MPNSWYTPPELHQACESGDFDRVHELVSNGTDVDVKGIYSMTPLHLMCELGHVDMVKELISMGANINAQTTTGRTPLRYAAVNGNPDCVLALLLAGADVSIQDDGRWTCLHAIAYHCRKSFNINHELCVKYLLGAGIDTTVINYCDCTAKTLAQEEGNIKMVHVLEEYENLIQPPIN